MGFKIISVVGARPNFIKIAPIDKAFQAYDSIQHIICHTGQHFDPSMSKVFFEELNIPKPAFNLGVSGGSHAHQTAAIMTAFEEVLLYEKPDLVIVPGDVNSTLAASLVAAKLQIPVAHVEAGLRSYDRRMPEEINRIIADQLSDLLFVTEQSGIDNLAIEGIDQKKIFFTGNVMIDSLVSHKPLIDRSKVRNRFNLDTNEYILCTFHRPSNVDDPVQLKALIALLNELSGMIKVVLPMHPRTKQNMESNGLLSTIHPGIIQTEPLGYIDFLALTKDARLLLTDSGGIQEETTFLKIPCITVRDNTERPITCTLGTNTLVGTNFDNVRLVVLKSLKEKNIEGEIPPLWDGNAAIRICQIIDNYLNSKLL
ncbi:MAG: UDP-N-acetylglucosamine 2-epimerase (non-hydrolyzing) [Bacteroidales bacterium]|nr:UDP-N-acetylglucosamine 2-epimerase (non-hydrolyzing) [Bacteroidales bacterium]